MGISRRDIVIGLSLFAPAASVLSSMAFAAGAESPMLKVSRVIVGRDDLDPAIAERIYDTLKNRVDGFSEKLDKLAAALSGGKDRDASLAALSEPDLDLALAIAQPWYVGVIGEANDHSYDDDAVFVTFLGAQSMALVERSLPMPSYPRGKPGWWAEPPDGVTAPAMPANVRDWAFVPGGATGQALPADPKFLELVTPTDAAQAN